jgi:hypothetical protein
VRAEVRLLGLLSLAACARAPQPTAAEVAPPPPLPVSAFVPPHTWKPARGHAEPVEPPALSELTWYVLIDQYEPHQKRTPEWQPLAADRTVEIAMPPGSHYRCVAVPLHIEPKADDMERELEGWFLARDVLCSSDGFRTWTSQPHRIILTRDGKRELDYRSDGWLRERAADGTIIHTVVSLRAEQPRREATTGPPQVLTATH